MRQIRLELARTKDFPNGDPRHGYVIRAPLTRAGKIDAKAFRTQAQLCTVRSFAPDKEDEQGLLVRTRNGWAFSYAPGEEDDEPIFRLGDHVFKPGEYVTITEHDGEAQTFRVVEVSDVPAPARPA
jgi:hypothetical protein